MMSLLLFLLLAAVSLTTIVVVVIIICCIGIGIHTRAPAAGCTGSCIQCRVVPHPHCIHT
jgi:hypothetical protein